MTRIGQNLNSFHTSDGASYLSNAQLGLDALQYSFSSQATNSTNLLAMMAGGLAYRLGNFGVCSVGAIHELPLLAKILAPSIGVTLEVAAFRGVNHAFGASPERYWDAQGFAREMINFGSLKGVARLMQGGNPITMHVAQNLGLILGEEVGARIHLTEQNQKSFAERFVNASALNLALGAGTAFSGMITGRRVSILERGLEQRSFDVSNASMRTQHENERVLSMSSDRIYLEPSNGKGGPLNDRFSLAVAEAIEAYLGDHASPEQIAIMQLHEMGRTILAATNEFKDRAVNDNRLEDMLFIKGNPFLKIPETELSSPELLESFQSWSGFTRLRDIAHNSQLPNSMRCAAITALAFSNHADVKEVLNQVLNEADGIVAHAPMITQRRWTAKAALQAFEIRQTAPFVRQKSKPYRRV